MQVAEFAFFAESDLLKHFCIMSNFLVNFDLLIFALFFFAFFSCSLRQDAPLPPEPQASQSCISTGFGPMAYL